LDGVVKAVLKYLYWLKSCSISLA